MRIFAIIALVCVLGSSVFADDLEVRFHESILNSVVQVLAPVKGKGSFDSPVGKKDYTWALKKPRLTVKPDGLSFVADTSVNVSGFAYDTKAKGKASAKINDKTGKMDIKVTQASFALEFNVFGNRIHITDIDITGFVGQPLSIDIPSMNQVITIPAEGDRPAKTLKLETSTPNIQFAPPFLVVVVPLQIN